VVALGGVHVTFRREIGIYERVEVRSRVAAWDEKWVVIVSCFVRRVTKGRGDKAEEELCAVGLSKYVVKKGRFTVRPERVFRVAGWLPEEPCKDDQGGGGKSSGHEGFEQVLEANGSADTEGNDREEEEDNDADGGLRTAQVPELAEKVILDEETAAAAASPASDAVSTRENRSSGWNAEAWSWGEIEEERSRGLHLAKGWLALDAELYGECERR